MEPNVRTCDACRKETKTPFVVGSYLGPISICLCGNCIYNGAQPLWLWHTVFDCIGGAEHARRDLQELGVSFYEGEYISWDKIVELYVPTPHPYDEESLDNERD